MKQMSQKSTVKHYFRFSLALTNLVVVMSTITRQWMAKVTSGRARVFPVRSHRMARPFCFVCVPYADAILRNESTARTGVQFTSECSESSFLPMPLTNDGSKRRARDSAFPTTILRERREPFQIRKFFGPGTKSTNCESDKIICPSSS